MRIIIRLLKLLRIKLIDEEKGRSIVKIPLFIKKF